MVAAIIAVAAIFTPSKIARALFVLFFSSLLVSASAKMRLDSYQTKISILPTEECIFEGIVSDIALTLDKGKRATFQITGIISKDKRYAFAMTTKLFLNDGAAALPLGEGDEIRVQEKLKRLKHALSPGQFDPFWFGLARQIHANIFVRDSPAIAVMQKGKNPYFFAQMRHGLREKLLSLSTPREAAVLLALIIGDTNLFDAPQKQMYRNLGAGHLLAVSGLQISLLAYLFYQFFRFIFLLIPCIGRRSRASFFAACFSLISIWCFTFLCGAPPSAVRAAAMSSVLLGCVILSRQSTMADAFGIAGLFAILLWPASVVDPSFLLSYAAVFGLILVGNSKRETDELEVELSDNPWRDFRKKVSAILIASLAAGLMTLPVSAHLFGEITPTGILINTILVPIAVFLQTPAIFLGVIGACFNSSLLVNLGANCAGLLEALCEFLDIYFGNLQLIPVPSKLATVFLFIAATAIVSFFVSKRRMLLAGFALFSISGAVLVDYEWTEGIRITVLPVGQGDATVFEFPSKQVLLVDGGGNFNRTFDPGKMVIIPFLQRRRIRQIDAVVLSHPDSDHLLGLLSVIENFPVRELWYRKLPYHNALLTELLQLAKQKNVKLKSSEELTAVQHFGDATVQILKQSPHPYDKYYPLKTNDSSLVLRVALKKDSALWPGDIEAEGEKRLLQSNPTLAVTVVKAPHHGSKTSSTTEFVKSTNAKHVVFCTQDNNMWRFPHSQIVKRWQDKGAKTWNTGTQGEITIWLTGHGTLVNAFYEDNFNDQRN